MAKLTKKEKAFTTLNAQDLFVAREKKNAGTKVYNVLNSHGKQSLTIDKEYTFNTKKHGKLSLRYTKGNRTAFDEKAFAEKHPGIYKKFMTTNTVTIANIKKID